MKPAERTAARRLRLEEGLPVSEIARRLGVAKSSVSRWVRDVELSAAQRAALREMNPLYNAQLRGQAARSASARSLRRAAQEHGRRQARQGDALHLQGCMLYWAEGAKSRNVVAFTNADAAMMELFVRFLRESYAVGDDQLTLRLNCHLTNGVTIDDLAEWWLTRLRLPASSLRAPTINRPSAASRRRRGHVLPHGIAQVRVHSTFVVQSIYGAIQEYAGVERPEWLDLR